MNKGSGSADYRLQETTIWSFKQRGNWATHRGDYPGNWSPHVPRNVILRYSKEGELVLDPFVGSGTTTTEAQLLRRHSVGVDINPKAIDTAKSRVIDPAGEFAPILMVADARNLPLADESVDLIVAHPPYADIIQYSRLEHDLSALSLAGFLESMVLVAQECHRVLRQGGICALMLGDIRINGDIYLLGFECLSEFTSMGFRTKDLAIKIQHNCRSMEKWRQRQPTFLLLAHEYLFVLTKPLPRSLEPRSCR